MKILNDSNKQGTTKYKQTTSSLKILYGETVRKKDQKLSPQLTKYTSGFHYPKSLSYKPTTNRKNRNNLHYSWKRKPCKKCGLK